MRVASAGLALWATAALAIPSEKGYNYRSAEEMKDEMLPLSEMSFTGPITVGGPNVTLYGDASSIYEQILVLNPAFDAEKIESNVDENVNEASVERSLDTRQTTSLTLLPAPWHALAVGNDSLIVNKGNWNCNNGVPVERYYSQCANAINRLFTLGTSYCSVAPSTCARQFSQVSVYCQDIAVDMGIIVGKCGSDNGNGDTRARGTLHFTSHYTSLTQQAC
ncbi:secreted protein [Colletotrichum tofieldiae]|nr:secreted protein [Colletotrichum tofieldiae]